MRSFLLDNLGLKILALSLAVVLWWMVRGEQKTEVIYNVPLEVKNLSPELMASNDSLTEPLKVVLRGYLTDLLSLSTKQVKLSLDLKGAKEGERYYDLRSENVETPPGIEVISIKPGRVKLTLEMVGEKMVEVVPQIKGKPARGYEILRVDTDPDMVKVTGPRSIINGLRRIETMAVQIDRVKGNVSQEVGFDVGDKKIKVKDYKEVVVTVIIVPKE